MKTNNGFNLPASALQADGIHDPGLHPRRRAWGVLLLAVVFIAGSLGLMAQDAATVLAPGQAIATNSVEAQATPPGAAEQGTVPKVALATITGTGTNGLNLNFRNASIDLVLAHLVKAAGFVVVEDTPRVTGTITVNGENLTKDEAVHLLDKELNKNGYAAIRSSERILTIMTKEAAKSAGNKVLIGNDPDNIPDNDEMATWIIPIRFVEASQLVSDISPFVSGQATIIANQAGNSIVVTDVQSNIRHLVEIIKAIDSSAEDVTEVRVFRLRYADPTELASLLTGLFQDQSGGASSPIQFGPGRGGRGGGGFGGRGGGGFGGFGGGLGGFGAGFGGLAAAFGGQNNANSQQNRVRKRNQVVAVADARTSSVVVTATKDLMGQIANMIDDLDKEGKKQRMVVIPVGYANVYDVMQALQDTVGANTSRNTRNTQQDPFATRIQQNNQNNQNSIFGNSTSTGRRGGATGFGQ